MANMAIMFNTKRLVYLVKYALSNSGASLHFLRNCSPAFTIKIAKDPIVIVE
jgi:hypothetical protein